jgi:hypothetical protein
MTKEIPPANWQMFCDYFTESPPASVDIKFIQADQAEQELAHETPLQSLVFQKQNGECSDVLVMETGQPGERPARLEIVEPIRLVLRKRTAHYDELEILAESGLMKLIFHPGLTDETVDELMQTQ